MQRTAADGGIIISCDFCGTDWDQILPMIEGHHGSVICLDCLKRVLAQASSGDARFRCVMCLREQLPAEMLRWRPTKVQEHANPQATICGDCARQAAVAFSKDKDVDWTWDRKLGKGAQDA